MRLFPPFLSFLMNERPISGSSVRAKNDAQVELESLFCWSNSVCLFCKYLDYQLFPSLVFNCFCIAGICGEIRKLNSLVFFVEDRQVAGAAKCPKWLKLKCVEQLRTLVIHFHLRPICSHPAILKVITRYQGTWVPLCSGT